MESASFEVKGVRMKVGELKEDWIIESRTKCLSLVLTI